MKKVLLDIHLYLGLIFAPYFVIYGLSTLAFQHGWGWSPTNTTSEKSVTLPADLEDKTLAAAARDSLGIWGNVPEWRVKREDDGTLNFQVHRPGRTHHIALNTETGSATSRDEDFGIWGVIKWLHGMRGVEGSNWANTWWVYSEISVWALAFSVLGGVYFWWDRATERRVGWWILGLGSALSAVMMLYMAT